MKRGIKLFGFAKAERRSGCRNGSKVTLLAFSVFLFAATYWGIPRNVFASERIKGPKGPGSNGTNLSMPQYVAVVSP